MNKMFKMVIWLFTMNIIVVMAVESVLCSPNKRCCTKEGDSCGGKVINPRPDCCDGLKCTPEDDLAVDIPGTCQKCGGIGCQCGGFRINPPICCNGLQCAKDPNEDPRIQDLPGICQNCSPEGGVCRGNSGMLCCPGLNLKCSSYDCVTTGTCIVSPDPIDDPIKPINPIE